jgi:DNA helicase II / ATP-dependent DNA helicase PcrA
MKKVVKTEVRSFSAGELTDTSSFAEGDNVQHERFGEGVIISIEGQPPNKTALVDFKKDGKKKLLLRFAKLIKI